jgi:SUMO ligase MMS21 Smc5/6 complex component
MSRPSDQLSELIEQSAISQDAPLELGLPHVLLLSSAISHKRQADALERIADVEEAREARESAAAGGTEPVA